MIDWGEPVCSSRLAADSFDEINASRAEFLEAEEFAGRNLEAARRSVAGAGAGFAAGAVVASMAPTAEMWGATTFGTASTGPAISTVSGAAATKAAKGWLGGGTLAAGCGGTAAGSALLALAGPIDWTVAGATLLTSILLLARKKSARRKATQNALAAVKQNTAWVKSMDAHLGDQSVHPLHTVAVGGDRLQIDLPDHRVGTRERVPKVLALLTESAQQAVKPKLIEVVHPGSDTQFNRHRSLQRR